MGTDTGTWCPGSAGAHRQQGCLLRCESGVQPQRQPSNSSLLPEWWPFLSQPGRVTTKSQQVNQVQPTLSILVLGGRPSS